MLQIRTSTRTIHYAMQCEWLPMFCTVATNFLKFCRAGSANGVAFPVGASGVGCAAGRIYTGSGSGEGKCKLCFWSSSTASFPLLSTVNIGEVSSFSSHGQTVASMFEDPKFSTRPSCSCCRHCSSTVVSFRHSPSGFYSFGGTF